MSREEAIKWLKTFKGNTGMAELSQAFDAAIEALEQEPILDKLRTEIDRQQKWLVQAGHNAYNVDIAFDAIKAVLTESEVKP